MLTIKRKHIILFYSVNKCEYTHPWHENYNEPMSKQVTRIENQKKKTHTVLWK